MPRFRPPAHPRRRECSIRAPDPIYKDMSGQASSRPSGRPQASGPRCLVVMYHYVRRLGPMFNEGIVALSPGDLKAQLDALCAALEPVDWPTLWAWTQERARIPDRSFLLTFDDGLLDHADAVAPILERRSLRGVFFVVGETLTARRMLSAHAIHLLLANLGFERLEYELIRCLSNFDSDRDWHADLDSDAACATYPYEVPQGARLKYFLNMVLSPEIRRAAIDTLFELFVGSSARWSQSTYLNWDQLKQMQDKGHTIGAHGHTHEPLGRLTPHQQQHDISTVAALLNEGLGRDIRPFSYPFGSFTGETEAICRQSGFAHAFTTERAWITAQCETMCLPRVDTIYVNDELERENAACVNT
jgi:peptidoglycan/xylan/chitin deacetylase (PgdA/CDA1 family)